MACAKFLDLRKQGYLIYRVIEAEDKEVVEFNPNHSPMFIRPLVKSGEQMNEFDSSVETVVATPPLVGG